MADEKLYAEIIGKVQDRTPGSEGHRIVDIKSEFLNGSLYTVGFEAANSKGEKGSYINRVYHHNGKLEVFQNDEFLLAIVGQTHASQTLLARALDAGGIAGIIALFLTATICFLSIKSGGEAKIPDILSNGLSVILGFYFAKNATS